MDEKWYLIFGLAMIRVYAHDPREVFFVIEQMGDSILVKAEFPWTLRNALLVYEPSLKEASDSTSFEEVLFDYVRSMLVLWDHNGTKMELIRVRTLDNMGHSHQNDYVFTFQGNHLSEIRNELLFNVSDRQINYHIIKMGDETVRDRTSPSGPSFHLERKASHGIWWVIALLAVTLGYLAVRIMVPRYGKEHHGS